MKTLVFTGGHHTSALEVAKQLKHRGWRIVWFGHRHSMWGDTSDSAEYRDVTAAGIEFYALQAGKFYRTFHPLKLIRIPWGFIQSFYWLLRLKPAGIVSFGGYLAVPTVITGWILGIPAVTHEQTVVAGWANRLIARFAKKIAVTWPESVRHYPKNKVVVTGLPLRPEIIKIRNSSIKNLVYITGGKQGSHVINEAVFAALPQLLKKYTIIHQTGFKDHPHASEITNPRYQAFDYSSFQAISALSKAEVVISRAGAHTVYELGLLGKKSVLIPIPWVSHYEQDKNARILVDRHLAVVLPQSRLTPQSLITSLSQAATLTGQPLDLPVTADRQLIQLIESTFS